VTGGCLLCDPERADASLDRVQVWADRGWRLTVALRSEVVGFSYLEPFRHIPHVEDLDGDEAATFGAVLPLCADALRRVTEAERVFVYVFGEGIDHLHVHLAPHRRGDPLSTNILRGGFVEHPLSGGATELVSAEFPLLERSTLATVADRVARTLAPTASSEAEPGR
jgi:diadenosine tetraphosphate (Ap4A) HIT family hydrolase